MSPVKLDLTKSPHLLFRKNLARIAHLRRIAFDLERIKVNEPFAKEEMLRKSYLVYLVAQWEAFIESLALHVAEKLLALEADEASRKRAHDKIEKEVHDFHAPKTNNINRLIRHATSLGGYPGINEISVYWRWPGMSSSDAKERLEKLLGIRHQLAHTGKSSQLPSFEEAIEEMKFLDKLSKIMQSEIDKYVAEQERQAN